VTVPAQRSGSRHKAVQALYQWQLTADPIENVRIEFEHDHAEELRHINKPYFRKLLREISAHKAALDAQLLPFLERPLDQLDPVEHAILWIGAYELNAAQMPWRAVINEAVELAKVFGSDSGHKFVNGVLDKMAHSLQKPMERT
jgi:transcription antitermination protein NusB